MTYIFLGLFISFVIVPIIGFVIGVLDGLSFKSDWEKDNHDASILDKR